MRRHAATPEPAQCWGARFERYEYDGSQDMSEGGEAKLLDNGGEGGSEGSLGGASVPDTDKAVFAVAGAQGLIAICTLIAVVPAP